MKNPTGILMVNTPFILNFLLLPWTWPFSGQDKPPPPSSLEHGGPMAAVGRGLSGCFLSPVLVPSRPPQLHQGPRLDSTVLVPPSYRASGTFKRIFENKTKQNTPS